MFTPTANKNKLLLIAGPCVIETEDVIFETARILTQITKDSGFDFIFKSSYDKANRTSVKSFRGPGITKGLQVLKKVKEAFSIPVLTDIHSPEQASLVADVVDMLQIPAFLCRQTDLILAAGQTGKPVNIKKGQFLAPWDIKNTIDKFTSTGNSQLSLTERGTTFGYNNLVVDFRSIPIMRSFGYPVIFDVTHSLQTPGGRGTSSGGDRELASPLARAAVAAGVDGLFMEVHPDPDKALCDGPNMIKLDALPGILAHVKQIYETVSAFKEK